MITKSKCVQVVLSKHLGSESAGEALHSLYLAHYRDANTTILVLGRALLEYKGYFSALSSSVASSWDVIFSPSSTARMQFGKRVKKLARAGVINMANLLSCNSLLRWVIGIAMLVFRQTARLRAPAAMPK